MKRFIALIPALALASSSFAAIPFLHKSTQEVNANRSITKIELDDFSGVWSGVCVDKEDSTESKETLHITQTKEDIHLKFIDEEDGDWEVRFDLGKLSTSQSSSTYDTKGRIAHADVFGNNMVSFYMTEVFKHTEEDGSGYGYSHGFDMTMKRLTPDTIEIYSGWGENTCSLHKVG